MFPTKGAVEGGSCLTDGGAPGCAGAGGGRNVGHRMPMLARGRSGCYGLLAGEFRCFLMASPTPFRGLAVITRRQSLGEEIANSISHGAGLLAALIGSPILIASAVGREHPAMLVGACVFSAAVVLMYFCSTFYHAMPEGRAKRVFRVLDHLAIFILIAGTYTPITLGILKGAWGWALFGAVWLLAAAGITLKLTGGIKHPWLSTGVYLLMGWLALAAIRPLWLSMPLSGFIWLAAGGLAYTAGTAIFALDERMKYGHFIWHLFVLTGTVCHFTAVLVSM